MKPNTQKLIAYLFIFFGLVSLLTCGMGCSEEKKLAKAEQRVLLNPQARHNVWIKESQLFPCVTDSVTIVKEGAIITEYRYDTLLNTIHDSTETFYFDTLRITKTIHRTDTVQFTVIDDRNIQTLKDSIQHVLRNYSQLQGSKEQLNQELGKAEKRVKTLFLWLFGVALAVCVYIFLRIKSLVP